MISSPLSFKPIKNIVIEFLKDAGFIPLAKF